jgi:cysteinyl-tRNA synthetase
MAAHAWQANDGEQAVSAQQIIDCQTRILEALQNDLNTPQSLSALSALEAAIDNGGISIGSQEVFGSFLQWLEAATGVTFTVPDISDEQRGLLSVRETARTEKDWSKSDEVRDQLAAQGVGLKDTASGTVWFWQ